MVAMSYDDVAMSVSARRIDRVVDQAIRLPQPHNPVVVIGKWLERVDGRFMGTPVEVDPHEALLLCIRITAGEVQYCDAQISRIRPHEVFEVPVTRRYMRGETGEEMLIEERQEPEVLNRWVRLRDQALERLAKFSKMALDAGVEARQVAVAERVADAMVPLLRELGDQLDLTPKQRKRLPSVIEGCLRELEA